jgi:hypothetical protein
MNAETVWLRCQVGPGMFANEYAIFGRTLDGATFSLFADRDLVRLRAGLAPSAGSGRCDGWLRLLSAESMGEYCIAQLPVSALETGFTVKIACAEIQREGARQP